MNKYKYDSDFFSDINNERKAYWLGFICADGYIEKIKRDGKVRAMRLEIGISEKDEYLLELFLKDLKSDAKIFKKTTKGRVYSILRINNTKLCRDLESLGCTNNKSLTLEFPPKLNINKTLIRHFIRGYFDGDGCVSYVEREYTDKRNNKQYTQKNFISSFIGTESFLGDLSTILLENGIRANKMRHGNCGNAYEIRITNLSSLINLYSFLYTKSDIHMNRKLEKFKYAFTNYNITCLPDIEI